MAKQSAAVAQPFIEHVHELRQRLFISLTAVFLGSCAGYALSDQLFAILRRPLHQTLFYTTPTGAFSFVIKLSLLFGVIVALPVILYQIIRFLSPLMQRVTRRYVALVLTFSLILAAAGIASAYFVSLPSALHFLTNFHSDDIKSLITANEYFNFVLAYLAGSALLFQLPLVMMVINKITPLQPRKLMSVERYVILGSFIIGAILTPTPDPVNQSLMSVPIIITYQIGVVLVWLTNRSKRRHAAPAPLFPEIPADVMDADLADELPALRPTMPAMRLQPELLFEEAVAEPAPRRMIDDIRPSSRYAVASHPARQPTVIRDIL